MEEAEIKEKLAKLDIVAASMDLRTRGDDVLELYGVAIEVLCNDARDLKSRSDKLANILVGVLTEMSNAVISLRVVQRRMAMDPRSSPIEISQIVGTIQRLEQVIGRFKTQ